jgi:hypothetical protein
VEAEKRRNAANQICHSCSPSVGAAKGRRGPHQRPASGKIWNTNAHGGSPETLLMIFTKAV